MCQYCNGMDGSPFVDNAFMSAWVNADLNTIDISLMETDEDGDYERMLNGIAINYCPVCGRKLEDSDD